MEASHHNEARSALGSAFNEGLQLQTSNGDAVLEIRRIADLEVTSSRLIACDPLTYFDALPFTRSIPNGAFPVELSIARFGNGDERIAFVRVLLSEKIPVIWEQAITTDGEKPRGYSVDSGTGCFVDAEAGRSILKIFEEEVWNETYDLSRRLSDLRKENYRHTRDWAELRVDGIAGNMVVFSTGYGDGRYPTYVGLDNEGIVACLVTDFLL